MIARWVIAAASGVGLAFVAISVPGSWPTSSGRGAQSHGSRIGDTERPGSDPNGLIGAQGPANVPQETRAWLAKAVARDPSVNAVAELVASDRFSGDCARLLPVPWLTAIVAHGEGGGQSRVKHVLPQVTLQLMMKEMQRRPPPRIKEHLGVRRAEQLVGYAAQLEEGAAAVVARWLCVGFGDRILYPRKVDPAVASVLNRILAVRSPESLRWWRSFWRGLRGGGGDVVRFHIYSSIGFLSGRAGLLQFLRATLSWEDLQAQSGVGACVLAGFALRFVTTEKHVREDAFFTAEPRMRMALLFSVPSGMKWPLTDSPPLGQATHARNRETALCKSLRQGTLEARWRANFLSNHWGLCGPDIALVDLRCGLRNGLGGSAESHVRAQSALDALPQLEWLKPDLARDVTTVLREGLQRSSDGELARFVYAVAPGLSRQEPALEGPLGTLTMADRLLYLLGPRALDLPSDVRATLGLLLPGDH